MMRNKTLIILFFALIFSFQGLAQRDEDEVYSNFERNYNDLLHTYYIQTNEKLLNQRFAGTTYNDNRASDVADSVYQQRLKSIPSCVKLVYNSTVRNHIIYYADRIGDRVGVMLGMSKYYFPIFENILDAYGVPSDLKYLVVIESAFNPRAVSRAGATGLWQFMYATGKTYDLRVNSIVDDRRDPIKSTVAAAKYLKDLYSIYNDWSLVLAAYNCGPGNVNKAIKRSGKNDFWEIYPYLPKETRNYVPAFIAATYVMNFHNEHNIKPVNLSQPLDLVTDTVVVKKDVYFGQIETVMKISVAELRDLNPQYKMDYIPGTQAEYALKLPMKYINDFIDLEDSISQTDKEKYYPELAKKNCDTCEADSSTETVYITKTVYHKVKSKESWSSIARRYGVSVSDLRKWNKKIKKNNLTRGTMLTVKQRVAVEKKVSTQQQDNKQESIVEQKITENENAGNKKESTVNVPQNKTQKTEVAAQQKKNTKEKKAPAQTKTHTVKSGETIAKIAAKYKVSEAQILKANNLNQNSAKKIQPGQKLRIK
ncbi:MAG: transglycosylase SLT domain-containing protein [Bacteroidales bacterium]|nr:transglycosylase SLT domain-containing protein [Bacteroidales bacterium]